MGIILPIEILILDGKEKKYTHGDIEAISIPSGRVGGKT